MAAGLLQEDAVMAVLHFGSQEWLWFFFPMQSRTELLGGMQEAAGKRCVLLGWQQAVRIGGCDWHRLVLAGVLV